MPNLSHLAIFLSNNTDKKLIIENITNGKYFPELSSKKAAVFSEINLKELIDLEDRFGKTEAMQGSQRSIATLSGGEQKKALLAYCLSQSPDYLILDNPFDSLDITSQENLKAQLLKISESMPIVQLINRKRDLLPFIDNYFQENSKNEMVLLARIEDFKEQNTKKIFVEKLPEPIYKIFIENEELIKFENVNVKYDGRQIVKNINWSIKKSEFWQLIGPNGAGKSTLLSMIIGDNPKAYGQQIQLFGQQKGTGESVANLKKNIGYFTPSMTNLFVRNTSVEHMVVSGIFDSIGLYNIPSERHLRLANEWIKLLNMNHLAKKPFYKLPIGQQRLVMISRAMVKHPPLLILDEPMAGLDDENTLITSTLINKIANESDTAIIYVSHRKEIGLEPEKVFELILNEEGSTGKFY